MEPTPRHLTTTEQILIRDGILVEYAPGYTLEADYARIESLRGAAIRQLTRRRYTAVTRTALWIHTGRHLEAEPVQLTLSHPNTAAPYNVSRRRIHSSHLAEIGGMRVTIPATTCVDFLLLEKADIAREAIEILLEAGKVTPVDIEAQLIEQRARNGSRRARGTWRAMCLEG